MPNRKPGPSIKDKELYESLRDEGDSKGKAARISNAAAKEGRSEIGQRGGEAGSYDDWTVAELRKRARELNITGRSKLNKEQLVKALRNS